MDKTTETKVTRRGFLKTSTAVAGAAMMADAAARLAMGQASDKMRIGLLGCGGRGVDAVRNCVASSPGVELVAVADLFKFQADGAFNGLKNLGAAFKVTPDKCFSGLDCHKKLAATDVDLVVTAAPPGFRPMHLRACVEAGKHVFMEKPVGVDPVGCRSVIESGRIAAQKNLGIVAGTQRRHQFPYVETVKRLHDGAAGDILAAYCYWNGGGIWFRAKDGRFKDLSDFEWQCWNWYHWDWLSGDHIVEQHVHNLDVIQWVMKGPPQKIMGMGGRASRDMNGVIPGNIFDHFAIEFEWPGGVRVLSECRHSPNSADRVNEYVVGTKGKSNCCGNIWGETKWDYSGPNPNPYVQEHADLIKSIRDGKPLNEAEQVANSTLMAVGGRMSAYTGREFSWEWLLKSSKLEIFPKEENLKPGPGIFPPVAIPGKTELI